MPLDPRDQEIVIAFIEELRNAQRDAGLYPKTHAYQEAVIEYYRDHQSNPKHAADVLRAAMTINRSDIATGEPMEGLIGENIFKFARKIVRDHINGGYFSDQILQKKEPKWYGKFADCMNAAGVRSKEAVKSAWNFVKTWAKKIADRIITRVLDDRLSINQALDRSKLEARGFWRDVKADMGPGLLTTGAAVMKGFQVVAERIAGPSPRIERAVQSLRQESAKWSLESRTDAKERTEEERKTLHFAHGQARRIQERRHIQRRSARGVKGKSTGKGRGGR